MPHDNVLKYSFASCCESYFYFLLIEARTDQSDNALKIAQLYIYENKYRFQKITMGRDSCMWECVLYPKSATTGVVRFIHVEEWTTCASFGQNINIHYNYYNIKKLIN